MNRDNRQPVIEIFPERAVSYRLVDFQIRGGYDADIKLLYLCATHRFHFLFLQRPEQFWLHFYREIADLIQKDSSPSAS